MNFLGHSFFSRNSPLFLLGNICGDFYKGLPETLDLPDEMVEGIRFHRALDSLTDSTSAVKEAREKLSDYGLYSGIIIDIFYDHFLALYWNELSDTLFEEHSRYVYSLLEDYRDLIPVRSHGVIDHMREEDWFYSYRDLAFIEMTLLRISKRLSRKRDLSPSVDHLRRNYDFFRDNFFKFIDEIRSNINF